MKTLLTVLALCIASLGQTAVLPKSTIFLKTSLIGVGSSGGGSAPTFVKVSDSGANGCSSLSTCNLSFTPTTAGDLMIITFEQAAANTISSVVDTNGTPVSVTTQAGSGLIGGMYYVPNVAAGAHSVTVTYSGTGWNNLVISEYSGANASTPLDTPAKCSAAGITGVSVTCSLTTTGTNETVVAFLHAENTTLAVGSGFTSRAATDGNMFEDEVAATVGSYNAASATTSAGNWLAFGAAWKQ